jgi:hypothetical protein
VLNSIGKGQIMRKILFLMLLNLIVSNAIACGGTKDDEEKKRIEPILIRLK